MNLETLCTTLITTRGTEYFTLIINNESIQYSLRGTSRAGRNKRIVLKVYGAYDLQTEISKEKINSMNYKELNDLITKMYIKK